jgi:hypothetical protein
MRRRENKARQRCQRESAQTEPWGKVAQDRIAWTAQAE